MKSRRGPALIIFILAASWAGAGRAAAAMPAPVLSSECAALVAEQSALERELFLYQDFFSKDPRLLKELRDSGRELGADTKKRLGGLVDGVFGARLDDLESRAAALADRYEESYILALLAFDRYKIEFEIKNDKRSSLLFLEKANELTRNALRSAKKSADYYRLYGEIQNQFIPLKGGVSVIYYSTEAKKAYQKALGLERDNARALLLLGIWNVFAPNIAGGSVVKALDLIRRARRSTDDPYLQFLTYVWESLAQSNALKKAEAVAAAREALAIAPNNTWAAWILQELQAGRRPLDSMQS